MSKAKLNKAKQAFIDEMDNFVLKAAGETYRIPLFSNDRMFAPRRVILTPYSVRIEEFDGWYIVTTEAKP